jgi:hypothetical protein
VPRLGLAGVLTALGLLSWLPSTGSAGVLAGAEIDGVRLYMTPAEARGAVVKRLGAHSCPAPLSQAAAGADAAPALVCTKGIYQLRVSFASRPGQSLRLANRIQLRLLPTDATDADYAKFYNSVLSKYGPPLSTDPDTKSAWWCDGEPAHFDQMHRYVTKDECDEFKPQLRLTVGGDRTADDAGLILKDTPLQGQLHGEPPL